MDEKDFIRRTEFYQLDQRMGKAERTQERHEVKIENIEDALKGIKGNTNKIIWLIIGAVILAVLNLIGL